jgi:membrane-bound metal-dependent hydrolase YbcI (DUF457 family)
MAPVTHALIGYLISDSLPTRRQRVWVTIAAVIPDIDGLSALGGEELYGEWHHTFGHNVFFALAFMAACFAATRSGRASLLAFISFHSHLLGDLLGSGQGWKIEYAWPFSRYGLEFAPPFQWELNSWQNLTVTVACLVAIAMIGLRRKRTVLEVVSLRADSRVVDILEKRFKPKGKAA